jgi:hypothetical protein
MNVVRTALFAYLSRTAPEYHAKLLELREEVARWLAYVPHTFPHYTQHTIEHSEAIILNLSWLLFADNDQINPTVPLSGVEAYILSAAAYLHDAGMVASDREKEELLRSEEWLTWISDDGGGAARWRAIESLKAACADEALHDFTINRQVRYLIAEFIRRRHHQRAGDVIEQYHDALGRFDYGDPVLRTTVANVCIAHGLDRGELEDRERFPERVQIRDEPANVRFLAVLLRIGDLLDMRHDRACPLLLAAACPLPADSYAQWTQYQRLTRQLVAPDRIELAAQCHNQDEHRFLQDWCSWLVEEVRAGVLMMAKAPRHGGWAGPEISLSDGKKEGTISIRPAPGATYVPRRWQFELDPPAVFERLVKDVYDEPLAFIRELVQNALDAMRCRLYADLQADGQACPEYPIDVPANRLARYELNLSLSDETVKNALSDEDESRQVLAIDDCGLGMDQDVIERYFLQVGRSYYTTDAFRRAFAFHPISRFGVGFLSVFTASDHITVETLKVHGVEAPSAIRLTLTGPRSYILTEKGKRTLPGTRIALRLKQPLPAGTLNKFIRHLCRKVEFPIRVVDHGAVHTIMEEGPAQWVCSMPDPESSEATLNLVAIPVKRPGVRGEFYVRARVTSEGESWAEGPRFGRYREQYPFAAIPRLPESYLCRHGLARVVRRADLGYAIDDRRSTRNEVLDRRIDRGHAPRRQLDELATIWWDELVKHMDSAPFARGPEGWKYLQRLASTFEETPGWMELPGMLPFWQNGALTARSVTDALAFEEFVTVFDRSRRVYHDEQPPIDSAVKARVSEGIAQVLFADDLDQLASALKDVVFKARGVHAVHELTQTLCALTWKKTADPFTTCALSNENILGLRVHAIARYLGNPILLNRNHPIVGWILWATANSVPGVNVFRECLQQPWERSKAQHLLRQYAQATHLERRPPDKQLTDACYDLGPGRHF